ncbi:MAG: choice-of-anchor D domain-containing protein [Candidatus Sulfotelmatobacter sp.]
MPRNLKRTFMLFSALCALFLASSEATVTTAAVYPQNFLNFGMVTVGKTGAVPQTISVYNQGTASVTVNSVTFSIPQFQLVSGSTPVTIAPQGYANFLVSFTPAIAKIYTGTMTFTMAGSPNLVETLTGTGSSALSVSTVSAKTLTFSNQAVGTVSAPQTLTITNTGRTSFRIVSVAITGPFAQTGFTTTTAMKPGAVLTLQITYAPFAAADTIYGNAMITYDTVPSAGVSLVASAVAPTSLGINSFPTLPSSVQAAAYSAPLSAVGGVAPYTWSLTSGSKLPSGLTLSSAGVISGTVASTVGKANYAFTVQVTDSNTPPSTFSAPLTLPVAAPTGSNCNNIFSKGVNSPTPLVSLMDLGTNLYKNLYQGGLYANGVNTDDPAHDAFGQGLAAGIQPLDINGNPSPTGKEVLLTIGQSNTTGISQELVSIASVDSSINPNVEIVDGGTGSAGGAQFANINSFYWTVITNNYLPNAGVTAQQVVAVWLNDVDAQGNPPKITSLQSELESMARNMLVKFPNLKIIYLSSVNYTGYSNGVVQEYNEPFAYEAGFGVKLAIQDQLNGINNVNFDPSKGTVVAPWMAWGPYYWANGLTPNSDSTVWACTDLMSDGTHPAAPAGRIKASGRVLNFMKTDDTASPWFLAH